MVTMLCWWLDWGERERGKCIVPDFLVVQTWANTTMSSSKRKTIEARLLCFFRLYTITLVLPLLLCMITWFRPKENPIFQPLSETPHFSGCFFKAPCLPNPVLSDWPAFWRGAISSPWCLRPISSRSAKQWHHHLIQFFAWLILNSTNVQ